MPIKIHEEENFLRIPFHSSLPNFDSIFDSDALIAKALSLLAKLAVLSNTYIHFVLRKTKRVWRVRT